MDEPRWLTDDQQQSWRKLIELLTRLPAALEAQLQRDSGLTHMGYFVLVLLSERPDRTLAMSKLAASSSSSLSRLSHVVARLESQGWVRRERSPGDGRVQLAVLTDAGWDKVLEAAPGHVDEVRRLVFESLDETQTRQLDAICDAMLPAVRAAQSR
jgi:DNA-binding MarR family transcriptional regulator